MHNTCEGGVYLAPAPGVRSKEDTAADPVLGAGARSHADSAPAAVAAPREPREASGSAAPLPGSSMASPRVLHEDTGSASAPPGSATSPPSPPKGGTDTEENPPDAARGGSGSSTPGGSPAPATPFAAPVPVPSLPEAPRPRTRLQSGITEPKQFTDGTIRYGNLCSTGEPQSLQEALGDPNWKKAMEEEYATLLKNGTWHLVPSKPGIVVWTSLGPLPRWVPGPTTRWAPGTTRLALHGT
jgi:hypothetical protein